MKAVIQRVKSASVTINDTVFSQIGKGVLILLGVEKGDNEAKAEILAHKISNLRIFEDENQKMNLSIKDIQGEFLVVSQFTLAAKCKKGTRPSFDNAENPALANELYEKFVYFLNKEKLKIKTGKFGAMMDVSLINDGPVTFVLEN